MNKDGGQTGAQTVAQKESLLRERRDNIEILSLNRPAARNSLSEALISQLQEALDDLAEDINVRAIIIAANGAAFCAGHDLKELTSHRSDADGGKAYFTQIMLACSKMMQTIVRHPRPIVAAVQGVATAAGCQLVASCDLAIASSTARFATPGVDIGLFCSTPMVALSRNLAKKHALEMLLTGDMISAEDAYRMALINRIVSPGSELQETLALARQIASKSPAAIKVGKEAFYKQRDLCLSDAYQLAAETMVDNMLMADAEEGIAAFLGKRPPRWTKE